jgi:hypothetical protein
MGGSLMFAVIFNLVFVLWAIVGMIIAINANNLNLIVVNGFLLLFFQREFHRSMDVDLRRRGR